MDNKEISILIVDDDEPLRRLLASYLSFYYTCATAASADEATMMLEARSFNLLITDTRMPGASGLELCQFVRQAYPETVVILTLETDDFQSATHAMQQGAYDCITKPFDFSNVLMLVDRAAHHQALIVEQRPQQAHDARNDICFDVPTLAGAQEVSAYPDPDYGKALAPKSGSSNRRMAKRVPFLCEVECEGLATGRFTTRINDLSTGGVFIDSMTCLSTGSLLKLSFRVRSIEVKVIGEVRYSMSRIGMGIRFLDLRPEHFAAIQSVVEGPSGMHLHHHIAPAAHPAAL